jgi:hypothetical protein
LDALLLTLRDPPYELLLALRDPLDALLLNERLAAKTDVPHRSSATATQGQHRGVN